MTVSPHVVGVSGATFSRYATRKDAEAAFRMAQAAGTVRIVSSN